MTGTESHEQVTNESTIEAVKRKHVRESTFGSYEQVKKINACEHEWEDFPAILFKYLKVDRRCKLCGTWQRLPDQERLGLEEGPQTEPYTARTAPQPVSAGPLFRPSI